jgi:hypothetical protein
MHVLLFLVTRRSLLSVLLPVTELDVFPGGTGKEAGCM